MDKLYIFKTNWFEDLFVRLLGKKYKYETNDEKVEYFYLFGKFYLTSVTPEIEDDEKERLSILGQKILRNHWNWKVQ